MKFTKFHLCLSTTYANYLWERPTFVISLFPLFRFELKKKNHQQQQLPIMLARFPTYVGESKIYMFKVVQIH
jgi:hypothetical protein